MPNGNHSAGGPLSPSSSPPPPSAERWEGCGSSVDERLNYIRIRQLKSSTIVANRFTEGQTLTNSLRFRCEALQVSIRSLKEKLDELKERTQKRRREQQREINQLFVIVEAQKEVIDSHTDTIASLIDRIEVLEEERQIQPKKRPKRA